MQKIVLFSSSFLVSMSVILGRSVGKRGKFSRMPGTVTHSGKGLQHEGCRLNRYYGDVESSVYGCARELRWLERGVEIVEV